MVSFFVDASGQFDGPRRADETTEVTAYALRADDAGLAGGRVKDDGLVPAVVTRDLTAATAHTLFPVNLRIDDGLSVEIGG